MPCRVARESRRPTPSRRPDDPAGALARGTAGDNHRTNGCRKAVPRSAERLERLVRVTSSRLRWDRLRPRSELVLLWLIGVVALVFYLGTPRLASTISDVRVWPAPEYTRITIESNQADRIHRVHREESRAARSRPRRRDAGQRGSRGCRLASARMTRISPRHVWRAIVPEWYASCSNCAEKSNHRRSRSSRSEATHTGSWSTSIRRTRWTRF